MLRGPWKMAGQEMMILAVFQDGDEGALFPFEPNETGELVSQGTEHWPRYLLSDRK